MHRRSPRRRAALVTFALLIPTTVLLGEPALAADCLGRSPTKTGTPGADTLEGTPGDDVIAGLGGDDTISGMDGNDRLCGGPGDDVIDGGTGQDRFDGGPGRDTASFASSSEGVFAHLRAEGPARSTFDELDNIENLIGSPGPDRLAGGPARNVIDGGGGNDTFLWYPTDSGDDQWIGGDGTDLADYQRAPGPVTADLSVGTASVGGASTGTDSLSSIEDLRGSAFTDHFTGDAAANTMSSFIDTAVAGDDDVMLGGEGNDRLAGSAGAVKLDGGAGSDGMFALGYDAMEIKGGDGDDFFSLDNKMLHTFGKTTTFDGGNGNDFFIGTNNADLMSGGPGNDTLIGEYGNDVLDGGADSDSTDGGPGNDVCIAVENPGSCAQDETPDSFVGDPPPPAEFSDIAISMAPDPAANQAGVYLVDVINHGPSVADAGAELYFSGRVIEVESVYGGCSSPLPSDTFRSDVRCQFLSLDSGESRHLKVKVDEVEFSEPIHTAVAYNYLVDPTYLYLAPAVDDTWDNNTATIGADNLQLTGLEITQGIQNLNNDVLLISGRKTIVRAYVKSIGGRVELAQARLKGRILGGDDLGTISARSPVDVVENPKRKYANQDFIFELPETWLADRTGTYTLEVTFEGIDRQYSCEDEFQDCSAIVTVTAEQPLPEIVFVGIGYQKNKKTVRATARTAMDAYTQLQKVVPIHTARWVYFTWSQILDTPPDNGLEFEWVWLNMAALRLVKGCVGGLGPNCIYAGIMEEASIDGTAGLGMGSTMVGYTQGTPNWVIPHEFTHVMGRLHTDCPEMITQPVENYPYPDGILSDPLVGPDAYWGTDVYNGAALPSIYDPAETHDLMSYCDPVWISDYTWGALIAAIDSVFRAPSRVQVAQEVDDALIVRGRMAGDGTTGSFEGNVRGSAELSPEGQGSAAVRFLDATGTELSSHTLALHQLPDSPDSLFVAALEPPAGTARLDLMNDGLVLDSIVVSDSAPAVSITTFEPQTGKVMLGWDASDPDGDEVTVGIDYSPDGGATWTPLAVEVAQNPVRIETSSLAASSAGMLRVTASDGFNVGAAASTVFEVAEHAPEIGLASDPAFRPYLPGQELFAEAAAFDAEDGLLPDEALVWSSDRDGEIGTGARLAVATNTLSPGEHLITVTATDSSGMGSSVTRSITVFSSVDELPTCKGQIATLVGTAGKETIRGTSGIDVIVGAGGNDVISGGAGRDVLCGGPGSDRLSGDGGRDSYDGGPGNDTCIGPRKEKRSNCEHR